MSNTIVKYEDMIRFIYNNSYINLEDIECVIDLETEYMILHGVIDDVDFIGE